MPNKAMSLREVEGPGDPSDDRARDLERLASAIRGIRYGEVRVVIQDGVIVQIERLERQRLR